MIEAARRRRAELARRERIVRSIEALFVRDDDARPRLFGKREQRALLVVLRAVTECDAMLRHITRSKSGLARPGDVDDLCITIRATMDWYSVIKDLFQIVHGVHLVRPRRGVGSPDRMSRQHAARFARLQSRDIDLPERMSLLLSLIQIELVFFGHMW